jgi:hypothetical protein
MRDLLIRRLEQIMLDPNKPEGTLNYRFYGFPPFPAQFLQRHTMSDLELVGFFEQVISRWYRQH